jgi:TetR/AcrR family transcriptional regulator, cholesterol catabolism regulator
VAAKKPAGPGKNQVPKRAVAKGVTNHSRSEDGSTPPRGTLNEARWDEILEAAADVFFEKGYKSTTIQEIATRAGLLNKGSLYYYIETKEDLLYELAHRAHADALRSLEEDEKLANSDARTRLSAFIERRLADIRHPNPRDLLFIETEFRSLSAARLASVMAVRHQFHDLLRGIMEQGIAEGTFDPNMDTSVVVNSVFLLLNTTHRWYKPTGSVSPRALVEWYKTFILRGVGAEVDAARPPVKTTRRSR